MPKKCPFRKITTVTDYHWEGNAPLPYISIEDFDYCIGKECMAYHEVHQRCKIISRKDCDR